ncbi:unnamed protein product [Caenorhabditis sp. 36 PRJEB53466]|nr:unnamed protein product [Caenorhabditis sp. 36 PRJEB53466]
MTVNYQLDVSSGNPLLFLRLLARWRGSFWKSVIWELTAWLICFYATYFTYRYALPKDWQTVFEKISVHTDERMKYLPLTFLLGFFVTTVFERWRSALNVMPFIESVALSTAVLIPGKKEEDRLYRRAIVRYVVLHQLLVFRDISMRVRRRFPTLQYVVDAGFMEPEEYDIIDEEEKKKHTGPIYWVPINWANSLALEAHQNKNIDQPTAFNNLVLAIKEFRVAMETLIKFDSVPIPIAYPQVVFLAVRVYFTICIISRQFLISDLKSKTQMDWPVPIMTCLELIFVIGWMKVAEVLLNPLGEDDDDFEINWIIDKNISTGMAIVDTTHGYHPGLVNDKFADPNYLPAYATDSQLPRTLTGSAAKVELAAPDDEVKIVRVIPENAPATTERTSIFNRKAQSLRNRTVSISSNNVESPSAERKFNLSMPATLLSKSMAMSSKQTDRPTLETLNEETEPNNHFRRGDRVYSSDSGQTRKSSEESGKHRL